MTCREAETLLPRFFDGELDARQMRLLALHSTRCPACEAELRHLEQIQQLVSDWINSAADTIDAVPFWPGIEPRLGKVHLPARQRLREWWDEHRYSPWLIRVPALATATAIAVFTFLYATQITQPALRLGVAPQLAAVGESAWIDSLEADADSVAVFSDPDTSTTVLWLSDELGLGGD